MQVTSLLVHVNVCNNEHNGSKRSTRYLKMRSVVLISRIGRDTHGTRVSLRYGLLYWRKTLTMLSLAHEAERLLSIIARIRNPNRKFTRLRPRERYTYRMEAYFIAHERSGVRI